MIARRGLHHTTFQNMHIGVRAFGHAVSPVQDGLLAAGRLRALGVKHVGQKVDRLDIAMEKTGILACDAPV